MVVHDMRTPLTSIRGVLDLLKDDLAENGNNSNVQRRILIGQCGTDNLSLMIQSLLDISRFENKKMPLKVGFFSMNELCDKAIRSVQIQAEFAQQRIVLSGDQTRAWGDEDIIHRVLVNLLVNAIQASPEESTIELHVEKADSHVAVEIRDNGCGIPENIRKTIFDQFQGNAAGKLRGATSVGLGLAFCKLAVEAHGGTISVHSRDGGGSVFRIEIPATQSKT
jgi:signal transduction histidine kinase